MLWYQSVLLQAHCKVCYDKFSLTTQIFQTEKTLTFCIFPDISLTTLEFSVFSQFPGFPEKNGNHAQTMTCVWTRGWRLSDDGDNGMTDGEKYHTAEDLLTWFNKW